MTHIVRLYDEQKLLVDLQGQTLQMIHGCKRVEPVKKLVECHDILVLTQTIHEKFPNQYPDLPECDVQALLHLKHLMRELLVYHGPYIPHPDFEYYHGRVECLFRVFAIPRGETG